MMINIKEKQYEILGRAFEIYRESVDIEIDVNNFANVVNSTVRAIDRIQKEDIKTRISENDISIIKNIFFNSDNFESRCKAGEWLLKNVFDEEDKPIDDITIKILNDWIVVTGIDIDKTDGILKRKMI